MSTREELLRLLDDQRFQSGAELGQRLGMSRAAIQQHIAALRAAQVPIVTAPRQGYRLAPGVTLLEPDRISGHLSDNAASYISRIEVLPQAGSTNTVLLNKVHTMHGAVILAEDQLAGRGRREKHWYATPYRNLMLSVGWVFEQWPAAVTALGLVAAMAVARALRRLGVKDLGIKWPNDLMWHGRKLGGILVDLAGEAGGNCRVVIGTGVNVHLQPSDAVGIDKPWVDLDRILGSPIDRNLLAAAVVDELVLTLKKFPQRGFAADSAEWQRMHVLQGQQVEIVTEQQTLRAQVERVDADGALIVSERSGVTHRFFHGEVSVRQ